MTTPEKTLRETLLEDIQAGKVRMRPKLFFILRVIGTLLLATLALLFSSLVVSFIVFGLIQTGEHALLGFGLSGLIIFMKLFPWPLVLLDLFCIIGLTKLLSGFSLVYRVPHLPVYIGAVAVVFLFGILITLTPLHPHLLQSADRDELPVLGNTYERLYDTHPEGGVFRVRVATSTEDELTVLRDDRDRGAGPRIYSVTTREEKALPLFMHGQYLLIVGLSKEGEIQAERIQLLPPPPARGLRLEKDY